MTRLRKSLLLLCLCAVQAFSQSTSGPSITTTSPLPNGIATNPYSFIFSASGGIQPYTWSVFSGTLPTGLALSSGGTLSGTPTNPGTFNFSVRVTAANGLTDTEPFSLIINPAPLTITTTGPTLSNGSTGLPNGLTGVPYQDGQFAFNARGGTPPYIWSIAGGNIPVGLSLTPSSGALTGTPTFANTYLFTIRVQDSAAGISGNVATKQFTIRITAPLVITTVSPIPATAGSELALQMTATGGVLPYFWSSSNLPTGFRFDADGSGILRGTPAAPGNLNFTVQVQDSLQGLATKAMVMEVKQPLAITTATPAADGFVGQGYSLTFTGTGGNVPYHWTLDSGTLPPGLTLAAQTGILSGTLQTAGTYNFVIRLTDLAKAFVTKAFSIKVDPPPAQAPLLSHSSLEFLCLVGGDVPGPQSFSLISSIPQQLTFTTSIDSGTPGSGPPGWISVRPPKGSTPARITVAVNQAGLDPGVYFARVIVTTSDTRQNVVGVTLRVGFGQLDPKPADVQPSYLRFSGLPAELTGSELILLARNPNVGAGLAIQASVLPGAPWLSVTPAAGQATANAPVTLRVRINAQGLPPGPRRGVVRVNSEFGPTDVPVSLFVREPSPVIGLNISGVRFEARQGNGNTNTRNVNVLNLGQGLVNWTAEIVSGSEWLSLGETSGSVSPAGQSRLPLSANTGSLPPGNYQALIRIVDPAASNSPQYLTAALALAEESRTPRPDPSPSGLFFVARAGAAPPAAQQARVFTSSQTPVAFQASANTADGGSWLALNPATGTTSTQSPAALDVTVAHAGLAPGVYTGDVTYSLSTTEVRSTNITLVVQPALPALAGNSRSAAGCTPSRLSLTQTGLVNSFAAPAGFPTPLIVRLADDCGDPVLNGQVVATFSNGDPVLTMRLTIPENGLYSATWAPAGVTDNVTVTARASATNLASTTAEITGAVTANRVPVLLPNRVVNNLNGINGDPLAPGTVAQIHGVDLAPSTVEPGVLPLRTTFNGTRVLVGAREAPLYFLSEKQLNVQLPTELQPNREYQVVVEANGGTTLADTIGIAPATPGVAAFTAGGLIAQHPDYSLVTPEAPATQGEAITIYLVGMGATDIQVASGTQSPSGPLASAVAQPTVTIGGRPAEIIFAGLTPLAVGLYQINLYVPPGGAGNLPVEIRQGGVLSNATTLPVR